jgi:hypothetical protein
MVQRRLQQRGGGDTAERADHVPVLGRGAAQEAVAAGRLQRQRVVKGMERAGGSGRLGLGRSGHGWYGLVTRRE